MGPLSGGGAGGPSLSFLQEKNPMAQRDSSKAVFLILDNFSSRNIEIFFNKCQHPQAIVTSTLKGAVFSARRLLHSCVFIGLTPSGIRHNIHRWRQAGSFF